MGKRFKVGLALGGGAARGLSHIGIIEGLLENKIPIDLVAGTSMGAIIGAMYATNPDIAAVRDRIYAYLESDTFKESKFDFIKEKDGPEGAGIFYRFSHFVQKSIFYTLSLTRDSFLEPDTTASHLAHLIDDIDIVETKLPFSATALDINSGEEYIIRKGSLRQAVAASCAIPGIVPPVVFDGKLLVDGGWIDAIPIEPARSLGADIVIAVDVNREITEFEPPTCALDIVFRSDDISRYALAKLQLLEADFVLRPRVRNVHWADFRQVDEAIFAGRDVVCYHINEIRRVVMARRLASFFRPGW
jgi:NTE family protein